MKGVECREEIYVVSDANTKVEKYTLISRNKKREIGV
jgi:hypothetical protein